jgi:hypothetical protein
MLAHDSNNDTYPIADNSLSYLISALHPMEIGLMVNLSCSLKCRPFDEAMISPRLIIMGFERSYTFSFAFEFLHNLTCGHGELISVVRAKLFLQHKVWTIGVGLN